MEWLEITISIHLKIGCFLLPGKLQPEIDLDGTINLKALKFPGIFQLPHKNGTRIPSNFQVLGWFFLCFPRVFGCFSYVFQVFGWFFLCFPRVFDYVFQVLGWFFLCFPRVFGWVEPPPPPPPTASEAETFFAPPGLCKSNTAVAWLVKRPTEQMSRTGEGINGWDQWVISPTYKWHGGGFEYFLFSSLFGEMIQFD